MISRIMNQYLLCFSAKRILTFSLFIMSMMIYANEIYVDNVVGKDNNDGSQAYPFKTIKKALRKLSPGTTVFLVANETPYTESINLIKLSPETGKNITIDGQGATLNGLRNTQKLYTCVSPGLYKRTIEGNIFIERHFMLIGGKLQRMGIYYKLKRPPLPTIKKLNEGEWTYDKSRKELLVKISPEKKLSEIGLLEPADSMKNAILIHKSNNLIIKNLNVEYFKNDGCGLRDSQEIYLENIAIRYCGDDGISAHGASTITVKNFLSVGNPSAICHVDTSTSTNENVVIIDSAGTEFLMYNKQNSFKNIYLKSSGNSFWGGKLDIENAMLVNPGKQKKSNMLFAVKEGHLKNVKTENIRINRHKKCSEKALVISKNKFDDSFLTPLRQHFKEQFNVSF